MAARPKSTSGITSSTDVNLDFLTKEEREALLNQKMDMIRQRNKALSERHQLVSIGQAQKLRFLSKTDMIEADKKKAEDAGQAVKPEASKTYPAEGAPKSKGRGRGQSQTKETQKPVRERPKSSGDFRDSSSHDTIAETMDKSDYKGRGRGGHRQDHDRDPPVNTPKNRRKGQGHSKDEAQTPSPAAGTFEYEPIVDMSDLDLRFGRLPSASENRNAVTVDQAPHSNHSAPGAHRGNNRKHDHDSDVRADRSGRRRGDNAYNRPKSFPNEKPVEPEYDGRLKGDNGPPPDPSFNPLSDSRRFEKKMDNSVDNRQTRHPRNYGGGADLSKVKQTMKKQIEREKEAPQRNRPLDISMTGKERRNHEEWKQERERYDRERIQRAQNNEGSWKRAWDVEKHPDDYEERYESRHEPAKRPAGRIGSGRFDRGEREERPRSQVIVKAGGVSPDQPSPLDHYQLASSPKPGTDTKPGSKGRGRGRGRGRGKPVSNGGDKSPRPRTWSGGDDNRFVECQKEMLLVKFENTVGDNSVEVVYGDEDPSPPSTPTKSHASSIPGRGPTGRTPNQSPQKNQQRRGKSPQKNPKSSKQKGSKSSNSGADQDEFVSRKSPSKMSPGERGMVRSTSSHSQSHGDTDEWEDCTGSSGMDDLQVECRLNPEAPEFLPTSPDFMKTPPGHIKCLNWTAGVAGVGSPTSSLSQSSVTSPRLPGAYGGGQPPKNNSPKSTTSSSSPGSSVSQKAARRREEMDRMPMGDEPHPPPFVLDAVVGKEKSPTKGKGSKKADGKKSKESRDGANKNKDGCGKMKNGVEKKKSNSPKPDVEDNGDKKKPDAKLSPVNIPPSEQAKSAESSPPASESSPPTRDGDKVAKEGGSASSASQSDSQKTLQNGTPDSEETELNSKEQGIVVLSEEPDVPKESKDEAGTSEKTKDITSLEADASKEAEVKTSEEADASNKTEGAVCEESKPPQNAEKELSEQSDSSHAEKPTEQSEPSHDEKSTEPLDEPSSDPSDEVTEEVTTSPASDCTAEEVKVKAEAASEKTEGPSPEGQNADVETEDVCSTKSGESVAPTQVREDSPA